MIKSSIEIILIRVGKDVLLLLFDLLISAENNDEKSTEASIIGISDLF